MYRFTLLLIPLILLSSCTIDWNDDKDAKIAELEKQVTELQNKKDDGLFKKKQDCQQSYEKIWGYGNRTSYTNLKTDIFFSSKNNSCLVAMDGWWIKGNERVFLIADILAQKTLFSFAVDKDWNINRKKNLIESDLDKLKCEFNNALYELGGDDYFGTECSYIGN